MTRPVGFLLLFLMAVAPALPWRATNGEVLHHRLVVPAWMGAIAMVAAAGLGLRGLAPLASVGLAVFALAGIIRSFVVGVRARRLQTHEPLWRSMQRMVAGNPRLYGGLVVHAGVVLFAVAFAMSSSFTVEREAGLLVGESVRLQDYTVTYVGDRSERSGRKTTVSVDLELRKDGRVLGRYAPALSSFPGSTQSIGTPSVRNGVLEDVYLTMISAPRNGRVIVGVSVNPLVVWLWIGAGIMVGGTAVAAWPSARRPARRRVEPVAAPVEDAPAPAPAPSADDVEAATIVEVFR